MKIFLTGASSGIGLETAKMLVSLGHEVWGTSRKSGSLPQLKGFHPIQLELESTDSIIAGFATALAQAGNFDAVINNAGSAHFGPAEVLNEAEVYRLFQILFFGQIKLCQLAIASVQDNKKMLIVNISSLASQLPVPFMAAYNAAKAALSVYTQTLQLELSGSGIRLAELAPGDFYTNLNNALSRRAVGSSSRYFGKMNRAWQVIDRNVTDGPSPKLLAKKISRLIASHNPPPLVIAGD